MEEINFQNVNLLNSRVNLLSGNLLPMAADDGDWRFPIIWRVYSVLTRLIVLIYVTALIAGIILVPIEKAVIDAGFTSVVVSVEATLISLCLYTREKLLKQVIQNMNNILRTADDIMKDIVKSTLKPVIKPFEIYAVAGVISIIAWTAQPVMLVFDRTTFLYVDYKLPAAFTPEPFSSRVLFLTTIFMTIGSVHSFLRKLSLDVYMMHLVLMLTAQYQYTAIKLTALFQDLQDESQKGRYPTMDLWAERELRALCRRQNSVLHISFMLKKVLSVNFSLLYLSSVFRFCFIGILMSTIPLITFLEAMSILCFSIGSLMQFFLLCSSVHALLDASTETTDKAFDEGWYRSGPSMRRTFLLLMMTNNLECKITAIGKFNLSLSSFMTIMNQSYSIALLFLRMK